MKAKATSKPKRSGRRKLSGAATAAAMIPLALATILPVAIDRANRSDTTTVSKTIPKKHGAPKSDSVHMLLGNPSDATVDPGNPDNFLMIKDQYCLSYNNTNGGPNWVSWHLTASDIGDE